MLINADRHETEQLISKCHSPRLMMLTISAMICVRLRDQGSREEYWLSDQIAWLDEYANSFGRYGDSGDSIDVSSMVRTLDRPNELAQRLASMGFDREIYLQGGGSPDIRENFQHFSGLTGFSFTRRGLT